MCIIDLPAPSLSYTKPLPLETILALRRSIRSFEDKPITIKQLSQLLWAAYGVSDPRRGFLTCPSAGATFPLTIYVVVGENSVVYDDGTPLPAGSYRYDNHSHRLEMVKEGDLRSKLAEACLGQEWVRTAPISIIIAAIFERTTMYYGKRGERYVLFEAGHAGQNIYLEVTALGLGTVAIGAFYDDEVAKTVGLKHNEKPLYVYPVGVPKTIYTVDENSIRSYIESHR